MIELYYNTNTCRKRIAEIEPKEIDVSNPSGVLLKIYQESGYPNATDEKRLYAVSDGVHVCFSKVQSLENVSKKVSNSIFSANFNRILWCNNISIINSAYIL